MEGEGLSVGRARIKGLLSVWKTGNNDNGGQQGKREAHLLRKENLLLTIVWKC